MSTTALEIDTPQLCATQLIARPGTLPTISFPMTDAVLPDVDGVWTHLCEAAEFFGVPMPSHGELAAAISHVAKVNEGRPVFAIGVTISELNGAPQILVSCAAVTPARAEAVRIADGESSWSVHRATDPWWRRMAARTTSRGPDDQLARWLTGRGFADAVADGVPLLGALVIVVDGDVVGIENPEPTSILDQLARCGAIAPMARINALPADVGRAWWISPRYETHPVSEIGGRACSVVDPVQPPFARWS